MRADLCSCGSGRSFTRCHGDPRNEFARVQALAEARQIAVLFPPVRLRSKGALAFAERVANDFPGAERVPEKLLDEGLASVDSDERREVVDNWVDEYPDRWASLTRVAADVGAAERELLRGALEVAVAERQPTPRELLVELDLDGGATPAAALALVLPPPYVWSYDEARAAGAAAAGRPDPDVWLRAIEEVGAALIRRAHEERVFALAGRVAAELPFQPHRRLSRTLADACARVAREPDFRRVVAALILAAYVREVDPAGYITSWN